MSNPNLRLIDAKKFRVQSENDKLLLSNRIQLLKAEEQKAWKRIEETKNRARKIAQLREENAKFLEIKRQASESMSQSKISNNYPQQVFNSAEEIRKRNREIAEEEKRVKNLHRRQAQKDRKMERKHAQHMHDMVVKQHELKRSKIEQLKLQRELEAKQNYLKKVEEELIRKEEADKHIEEMERIEAELIAKLHHTKNAQDEAVNDLMNVMSSSQAF
eukprot:TRINITY_DN778086_c0_g1_i1.p1 TRINITY_DN778086_c0_g1~~TRINITY_DN778086_c0_g1_i1.p1  ORF type:complete len:238 (-),score=38.98 TRINITY_DN778086_c0_g1_i1:129-779(-)